MDWEHAVRVSPACYGLHRLGYEARRLSLYVSLPPPSSTSFNLFLPASHERSNLLPSVRYNLNNTLLVPLRTLNGDLDRLHHDLCSERYAQRRVCPTGHEVYRPGRYNLRFMRRIGMRPILGLGTDQIRSDNGIICI